MCDWGHRVIVRSSNSVVHGLEVFSDSAHVVFTLFKKSCPYDRHLNVFWIKVVILSIWGCLDLSEVYSHRNTCWQIDLLARGLYRTRVGSLCSEFQPWCRQHSLLCSYFSWLIFPPRQHIRFCACWFFSHFLKIFTYSRFLWFINSSIPPVLPRKGLDFTSWNLFLQSFPSVEGTFSYGCATYRQQTEMKVNYFSSIWNDFIVLKPDNYYYQFRNFPTELNP